MSSFTIETRVFPGFPVRELPHCTRNPDDRLELVVNKYTPKNNTEPADGDVTVILCHANGFHKEMYEPFFDFLINEYATLGNKIRAIWAVDMHHQGASGVLNENKLGGQVSWFDHCHDLHAMMQHYPSEFQKPIVGIGHSIGATQIFRLATMHPSLFACIVGIDPIISPNVPNTPGARMPASMSLHRRDRWPSRAAAEKYFKSSPFYQVWHPRVLDLHIKHGLRSLPTALYPEDKSNKDAVTLTTSKHLEVFTFVPINMTVRFPAYQTFQRLGELVMPVLYVQGEKSVVNFPGENELKMSQTAEPKEMIIMKGAGHLVPMEQPEESAKVIAPFLAKSIKKWGKEVEKEKEQFPVTLTVPDGYLTTYPTDVDRRLYKL